MAWLAVLISACPAPAPATSCRGDADCPAGYACDLRFHFCFALFEARDGGPGADTEGYRVDAAVDAMGRDRGGVDTAVDATGEDAAPAAAWEGLAGSDFGPWTTRVTWGSASGEGISRSRRNAENPALALDADDLPVVAWQDDSVESNYAEIYLRRFDGARWVELAGSATGGGISQSSGDSEDPVLALDGVGHPVVAWREKISSDNTEIYLRRFDGERWVALAGSASEGGVSASDSGSNFPSIALDSAGGPLVLWSERDAEGCELRLRRFDGAVWGELGGSASDGGISGPGGATCDPSSILVDDDDLPLVAWQHPVGPFVDIYVKRYDGSAWVEMGLGSASGSGLTSGDAEAHSTKLLRDSTGAPVVAWLVGDYEMTEVQASRFDGSAWQVFADGSPLEAHLSLDRGVWHVDIILDPLDRLVMVWQDHELSSLELARANSAGDTWEEVPPGLDTAPGISRTEGMPLSPRLACDGAGRLTMVWTSAVTGTRQVYARRLESGVWEQLGSPTAGGNALISQGTGNAENPVLALTDAGRPVVAWAEADQQSMQKSIYAKRMGTDGWEELGEGSASGQGLSLGTYAANPAIALDPNDLPIIAWGLELYIYAKRFDGSAWQAMGGSASGSGISQGIYGGFPALVLDPAGEPAVAWPNIFSGAPDIFARRYNGSAWVALGSGGASGGGVSGTAASSMQPDIAFDSAGTAIVVWQEYVDSAGEIYSKRLVGSTWQALGGSASSGGISNSAGSASSPSLLIGADDQPVVAWSEAAAGSSQIYVKRFDGTAWEELGAGSASAGGVSQSPGASTKPDLALDDQGRVAVAWQDDSAGSFEIYLRRLEAGRWSEVSAGSASGGGITNSESNSYAPSLASGGGRLCVAWHEAAALSVEIVLRCLVEP